MLYFHNHPHREGALFTQVKQLGVAGLLHCTTLGTLFLHRDCPGFREAEEQVHNHMGNGEAGMESRSYSHMLLRISVK